ncbi:MAG: FMN-binding protein [Lysobacterales bacterium]
MHRWIATALAMAVSFTPPVHAATVYETQAQFLERAFGPSVPAPGVIWLSGERKAAVSGMLGHDYPALRLRYWCRENRSAWLLEEIGKELPITTGVIIDGDVINSLRVLTYRENRGGEVVAPAFTDQFNGVGLNGSGQLQARIDGISGATLSVRALTRLAAMALYLDAESGCGDGA